MDPQAIAISSVIAVLVTEGMEIIKQSKHFQRINQGSETLNRYLGMAIAFLSGLGVHIHFDVQTGQLLVTGLFAAAVGHAFVQWAQQQAYYRLVIRSDKTVSSKP